MTIKEAKKSFSDKFFSLSSPVNGVGISRTDLKKTQHPSGIKKTDTPVECISVYLEAFPKDWSIYPTEFQGFPVVYEIIGKIIAL